MTFGSVTSVTSFGCCGTFGRFLLPFGRPRGRLGGGELELELEFALALALDLWSWWSSIPWVDPIWGSLGTFLLPFGLPRGRPEGVVGRGEQLEETWTWANTDSTTALVLATWWLLITTFNRIFCRNFCSAFRRTKTVRVYDGIIRGILFWEDRRRES